MLRKLSSTFRIGLAAMFAVLSSGLMPVYASAYVAPNPNEPVQKVTICHSTGQSGNYADIEVDTSAIAESNNPASANGHGTHENDIIPPFTSYPDNVVYPGKNWDAGKDIYANDCKVPPVDLCPNIDGIQTSLPSRHTIDRDDNCVPQYLATSHTEECGKITISLRNVSPWRYSVLIEHRVDGGTWTRADGVVSGAGIKAAVGVLLVNNAGNAPDDQTGSYTVSYPEDSGDKLVRYKVSSGTENDIYLGLPVGTFTEVPVETDCLPDAVTPLPAGIADVCGIGNDVVPDADTEYYTVTGDSDWKQDGTDARKTVRTITYTANTGFKFPSVQGWNVSEDGKTATYTYVDWGTSCTTVCKEFSLIHATNLDNRGWEASEESKVKYVNGGVELFVDGGWHETWISRDVPVGTTLSDLGNVIDFTPDAQYLGLHFVTSKGTLVYEKEASYSGKWWSHGDFRVAGGLDYTTLDTLDNIIAANPDVTIQSVRILYTNPEPASVVVTMAKFGCNEYTFGYMEVKGDDDEDEDPVPATPVDPVSVLGASTDGAVPALLPQTGATLQAQPMIIALAGILAYAVVYFAQPRRQIDEA